MYLLNIYSSSQIVYLLGSKINEKNEKSNLTKWIGKLGMIKKKYLKVGAMLISLMFKS